MHFLCLRDACLNAVDSGYLSAYPCQCELNINSPYLAYAWGVCPRRGKLLATHLKQAPAAATTNKSSSLAHFKAHYTTPANSLWRRGRGVRVWPETLTEIVARSWANAATLKSFPQKQEVTAKADEENKQRRAVVSDRLEDALGPVRVIPLPQGIQNSCLFLICVFDMSASYSSSWYI